MYPFISMSAALIAVAPVKRFNDALSYFKERLKNWFHRHVVDAFTAQHADEQTKPIAVTFALVGLYLHQFSQLVHVSAARLPPGTGHRIPSPHGHIPARSGAEALGTFAFA
jgi:hypothetical protein